LKCNTKYTFTASATINERRVSRDGSFKMPPCAAQPNQRLTFGFGSCLTNVRHAEFGGIFKWLSEGGVGRRLDAFLLLGDAAYTDLKLPRLQEQSSAPFYRRLLETKQFANFISHVPLFTMYDDHEIKNNYQGLRVSCELFKSS
jgi:phosphodiesterase/alkaline phosphatase D-like protein